MASIAELCLKSGTSFPGINIGLTWFSCGSGVTSTFRYCVAMRLCWLSFLRGVNWMSEAPEQNWLQHERGRPAARSTNWAVLSLTSGVSLQSSKIHHIFKLPLGARRLSSSVQLPPLDFWLKSYEREFGKHQQKQDYNQTQINES